MFWSFLGGFLGCLVSNEHHVTHNESLLKNGRNHGESLVAQRLHKSGPQFRRHFSRSLLQNPSRARIVQL